MTKRDKQHDARASSFKRIAKSLRRIAKEKGFTGTSYLSLTAKALDTEAKVLRSMR